MRCMKTKKKNMRALKVLILEKKELQVIVKNKISGPQSMNFFRGVCLATKDN